MTQVRRSFVLVATVIVVLALAIELGSPLLAHRKANDIASRAASAAAAELAAKHSPADVRAAADAVARKDDAAVDQFAIVGNRVDLRIDKDAHSYVLHRFKSAQRWYHVTAKASAVAQPRS